MPSANCAFGALPAQVLQAYERNDMNCARNNMNCARMRRQVALLCLYFAAARRRVALLYLGGLRLRSRCGASGGSDAAPHCERGMPNLAARAARGAACSCEASAGGIRSILDELRSLPRHGFPTCLSPTSASAARSPPVLGTARCATTAPRRATSDSNNAPTGMSKPALNTACDSCSVGISGAT